MQDILKNIISSNVNGYKIEKLLSCGTIGCIFLGSNDINELYALKFVEISNYNSLEATCLKILKDICYEDILCFVETFNININNKSYEVIVTEFLSNHITLYDYVNRFHYNKFASNKIISNIKKTLNKVHRAGIYHGDINSKNILIDPDNLYIKLIDFGNCKLLQKNFTKDDIWLDTNKLNFIIDYIKSNSS
jgi:serine/threonine protein kinase